MWNSLAKAWRILVRRLREQGLWVTLQWAYARGLPYVTGIPILRYSEVTPQIFVGPQYNRRGKRHLEANGITGDVNMRVEFDDAQHGLALEHYCHLPTVDDDAPTVEHLQAGVAFVDKVVQQGGKVYIHCKGGIGRAPTMAAAYLVYQGMSLDNALATIRQARPFINITPPQMEALHRYEAAVQQGEVE